VHHDIYVHNKNQQDALLYSQFILVINLYILRAGLLFSSGGTFIQKSTPDDEH